jgi:hypothetical protein
VIPPPSYAEGRTSDPHPRGDSPSRPGWARGVHRSLGVALVPWMLAGGFAAIVANHSSGLTGPCPEAEAAAAAEAELVAQRALGHLMVGASLAGERIELVDDSAAWVDSDELDSDEPESAGGDGELPQWARIGQLSGFELPPAVDAPEPDSLLAFRIESAGETWRCALALDGGIEVAAASGDDAFGSLDREADAGQDIASIALVDLVAAAGLTWALCACIVLWRGRECRRADLIALAAGSGLLLVFVSVH